jgi:hypothetical protein
VRIQPSLKAIKPLFSKTTPKIRRNSKGKANPNNRRNLAYHYHLEKCSHLSLVVSKVEIQKTINTISQAKRKPTTTKNTLFEKRKKFTTASERHSRREEKN